MIKPNFKKRNVATPNLNFTHIPNYLRFTDNEEMVNV